MTICAVGGRIRRYAKQLCTLGASRTPSAASLERGVNPSVEVAMAEAQHRIVETNGIRMHIAKEGGGG